MKKISVILVLVANIFLVKAQDRLFTYTYQSNVLNKGQREIEVYNTLRTGQTDYFVQLDNRSELELGLGNNLQTSFYLNLSSINETISIPGLKSIEHNHLISFSNEWKYKVLDPVANKIGLGFYGEYTIGATEDELEGKIIVDKKIDKFTLAANGVYELEVEPEYNLETLKWRIENKAELYASAAYEIKNRFNITLESTFKNVFENGELSHCALYAGPGFSYAGDNFFINFTVLPQIASFKEWTKGNLDLTEFEKLQCRVLLSYAL